MAYKQLIDSDLNMGYVGGWCLKYVQDAFHTDHPYPTALSAWNANYGQGNHVGVPPLGMTVPIYLTIKGVPEGHVAIRLDDGYVLSSTLSGSHPKPYYHKNIQDLINVYAKVYGNMTLLGWSEFVGTKRVVQLIPTIVTATEAEVRQAYLDVLERPADAAGIKTYTTNRMTVGQVRADLLASAEYKTLQAHKAAMAKAKAEAQLAAEQKAIKDAADKTEADRLEKERKEQIKEQPKPVDPPVVEKQNINILVGLLIQLINKILSIFK